MKIYGKDLRYNFYNSNDNGDSVFVILNHGKTSILARPKIGDWCGYGLKFVNFRYSERMYSVSKIPSGFAKREHKNRDHEVYLADLVEKSLSSNISSSFRFKIDLDCFVIGYDPGSPLESLVINLAYVSLSAAGVPCRPCAAVQMSFGKEWSLGHYGERVCIATGDEYAVTLFEAYKVPLTEMKNGISCAHANIKSFVDFNNESLKKATFRNNGKYCAPNFVTTYIGDVVDPRQLLKAYKDQDSALLDEYRKKFIERHNDAQYGNHHFNRCLNMIIRSEVLWTKNRIGNKALNFAAKTSVDKNISKHGVLVSSEGTAVIASSVVSNRSDIHNMELLQGNIGCKLIVHCYDTTNYGNDDKVTAYKIVNILKKIVNIDKLIRVVIEIISVGGIFIQSAVLAVVESLKKVDIQTQDLEYRDLGIICDGPHDIYINDLTLQEMDIVDAKVEAVIGSDVLYYSFSSTRDTVTWNSLNRSIDVVMYKKVEKVVQKPASKSLSSSANDGDRSKLKFQLFKNSFVQNELQGELAKLNDSNAANDTKVTFDKDRNTVIIDSDDHDSNIKVLDVISGLISGKNYVSHAVIDKIDTENDQMYLIGSSDKVIYSAKMTPDCVVGDLVLFQKKPKVKFVSIIKIEKVIS